MNVKSMLMPPKGAEKLASKLDPPEYGTGVAQFVVQDVRCCTYSLVSCTYGILAQAVKPLLWTWDRQLQPEAGRY